MLAGASGTVVECVGTEVLQRSLPYRVRAFSLGLADSVMVLAALLGALAAPSLTTLFGPVVGLAATLAVVAVGFPSGVGLDGGLVLVVTNSLLRQSTSYAGGPSDSRS